MKTAIEAVERGLVPDPLVRWGIRRLLMRRIQSQDQARQETPGRVILDLIKDLRRSPIAVVPEKANEQHYEVPPEFFQLVLGRRLKYSGCYWPEGIGTLDRAEEAMLELTAERAGLGEGQEILELGCGWGSLCLWVAKRYPTSRILALSNSAPQRQFIQNTCAAKGIPNVEVVTADMNAFSTQRRFDRVVSVEMFEHMRNYEELFSRIAGWLKPQGALFAHIFCHRSFAYLFNTEGEDDWMGRHFFTGGIMLSEDLLLHFQDKLRLAQRWYMAGTHYQKTAEAWLENLDARRPEVLDVLSKAYGAQAQLQFRRWRVFFLACAELFGYQDGTQWGVAHYLFRLAK